MGTNVKYVTKANWSKNELIRLYNYYLTHPRVSLGARSGPRLHARVAKAVAEAKKAKTEQRVKLRNDLMMAGIGVRHITD